MGLSTDITNRLNSQINSKTEGISFFRDQILIVDGEKELYDNAITIIDTDLLNQIDEVNDTIYAVEDAYQERINVGCRTDLFWVVTGIDTTSPPTQYDLTVTKMSVVGYGTTSLYYVDWSGVGATTTDLLIGFQEDNLHGIKYYNEPLTKDVGDTTVGSFIGTVGVASTILTLMTPYSDGSSNFLTAGQLVTSSKVGVFAGTNNTIIGIGTTVADLSAVNPGIGTTTVPTIILDVSAIGIASAPESDGTFVTFTILDDPDNVSSLSSYSIPFTANPFSPQTIGIMTGGTIGIGRTLSYDNSGYPSNPQSWRPENAITGIPDVEDVVAPDVGAGKVYYRVGFASEPTYLGTPQTEGTTVTVTSFSSLYTTLSSCTTEEAALTAAINARDAKESEFSSGISTFNTTLNADTAIREERDEYNLRIWGLRQSIGGEIEEIERYQALNTYIGLSTISNLLG